MSSYRLAVCSLVVLGFTLLIAPTVIAQETAGNIEGRIHDDKGVAVSFANVVVSSPALIGSRGAMSTSDGFFHIPDLPPGTYAVKVSHVSYQALTIADVVVQLGRTTTLKAELKAATYETEPIVVSGRKPILDFSTTEVGNNLSADVLDQLPTPRDYREVISYLPQANASAEGTNMAGSTGAENQFFIEGVNVTEAFFGMGGMRLPQNFVREVQVKQGGYEAEYGGIVNVITHSGSNELHGQVFGFFTSNDFTSEPRSGGVSDPRDFDRYDLGASLGGPIVRDKLWYFLAYNPTFEKKTVQIPGLSFFQDEVVSHLLAGKLTWSADPSTNIDVTVLGDPTNQDKVGGSFMIGPKETQLNPDPLLVDRTTGAVAASVSGRRLFGDWAMVETSVSRVEENNKEQPATEIGRTEPTYTDFTTSTLSGGMQMTFDHHTTRWTTDAALTVFAGSHEFKLGAAYQDLALDEEWIVQTPDGRPGILQRRGTSRWYSITLLNDFEISHRMPSAYLQDSWRVTNRLRVNAGLRWDGTYIVNPEGKVVQSLNTGYQPRTGFTYQLDKGGNQKVFGSYGRFYEKIPTIVSGWFFGDFYEVDAAYSENPLPDFTATPSWSVVFDNSQALSDDIEAPYLDEFTLGYERRVGATWKGGVRGIYRELGDALENKVTEGTFIPMVLGNPGRGLLDDRAKPVRRYKALEFSLENTFGQKLYMAASYVLSENYGNYSGAFDQDSNNPHTHVSCAFWTADQISEGPLPNDRTHVFKTYGAYGFGSGLTAGWFFTWMSGTPLCEYGQTWAGPSAYAHVVPRGTAGRTPSIWDANLRLAYDLSGIGRGFVGARPRMYLDIFHLFSQRDAVSFDEIRYTGLDAEGNQVGENPNYGNANQYQLPMMVRLGIETSF